MLYLGIILSTKESAPIAMSGSIAAHWILPATCEVTIEQVLDAKAANAGMQFIC